MKRNNGEDREKHARCVFLSCIGSTFFLFSPSVYQSSQTNIVLFCCSFVFSSIFKFDCIVARRSFGQGVNYCLTTVCGEVSVLVSIFVRSSMTIRVPRVISLGRRMYKSLVSYRVLLSLRITQLYRKIVHLSLLEYGTR